MMFLFEVIFFGIFGLIVGSFLNVIILRHNTGRSIMGRSGCMSCGEVLPPHALIPILSWIILRGRCSMCEVRISIQYPFVEVATGVLFAMVGLSNLALISKVFLCALIAILVAIAVYDIRHTIIPNAWVYSAALCAALYQIIIHPPQTFIGLVWIFMGGLAVALPLYLLWLVTRGRGIGLGDAKLAFVSGLLLGFGNGIVAVALSFMLGAFVSAVVLLPLSYYRVFLTRCGLLRRNARRGFTMKSEIPFGPFLIAGTLILWFFTTWYEEHFALSLLGLN